MISNLGQKEYIKAFKNTKASKELFALLYLLERITQSAGFDELLRRVLETVKKVMRVEAGSIMLLDGTGDYFEIHVPTGPLEDKIKGAKIPVDKGYAGRVAKKGQPIIANNVHKDDGILDGELSASFTTRNLICVPMHDDENNLMGVLEVQNRHGSEKFNKSDLPILQTIASHTASAIQRIRAKEELYNVLQQQNLLFKEIHHRVKNDFAIIAGIIEIERVDLEDSEAYRVLGDVQSRMRTMSIVYDLLTGSIDSRIEVGTYFERLAGSLSQALSHSRSEIEIEVDASDFKLDSKTALYCGLLVNELLLNTFKHAFNDAEKGRVDLEINKENNTVTIIYSDDGKGLPEDFKIEDQTSHGFEIIKAIVKQLNGSLQVNDAEKGASFIIEIEAMEDTREKRASIL